MKFKTIFLSQPSWVLSFQDVEAVVGICKQQRTARAQRPIDRLQESENQLGKLRCIFFKIFRFRWKKYITKLDDRLQCADIDAPLDYSKPDDLRVKISMMQVRAAESSDKNLIYFSTLVALEDGFTDSLEFSLALSIGNPQNPLVQCTEKSVKILTSSDFPQRRRCQHQYFMRRQSACLPH